MPSVQTRPARADLEIILPSMPIPIIALHYWAGAGRAFDLLRRQLPAHQHLLAPDLPGFGARAAPAGFDYSVEGYADWLAAFIAERHLTEYLLVGHSMGGKIALAWAARQPAGLRGLLLLSPSPPGPEPITAADRAASLAAYGQPAEAKKTLALITAALPPHLGKLVIQDNLRTSRAAWDAWLLRGSREDLAALMPRIQAPCRLLVGAADRAITPLTQRQLVLPYLPATTFFEEVAGAGHLLPLEAPDVVVAALTDFG